MITTPLSRGTDLKNKTYQVDRVLGKGGFGMVYLGQDLLMGKTCAIKESADQSPDAQAQFEVEARILANLNHPNLVRVTDNFVEQRTGRMYLVMEFVEGEDLEEKLERLGPLPEDRVTLWMDQVLAAVAYLHAHQPPICHRDIKPANIRVLPDDRTAKLVDFGIAKVGGSASHTRSAARAFSDGFSPLEQYGTRTDTHSDVYALGATYYALLTGVLPTPAPDRHAGAPLPPLRQLNPRVSPALEAVVMRALEMDPQRRFRTGGEMRQAMPSTTTIICPHCGRQTSVSARFCPGCQTPLTAPPTGAAMVVAPPALVQQGLGVISLVTSTQPFPRRRVVSSAVLGALVALVLTGAAVAMFPGGALVGTAAGIGLLALVTLGALAGALMGLQVDVDSPHFLVRLALAGGVTYGLTLVGAITAALITGGSLLAISLACFLVGVLGATAGAYLTTTPMLDRFTA